MELCLEQASSGPFHCGKVFTQHSTFFCARGWEDFTQREQMQEGPLPHEESKPGFSLILASLLHSGLCQEETACQVSIKPCKKRRPLPPEVLFVFGIQGPWDLLIFIDVARSSPSLASSTLYPLFCLLLVFCCNALYPTPSSHL